MENKLSFCGSFFPPTYPDDSSKPTTDAILICLVLWVNRLEYLISKMYTLVSASQGSINRGNKESFGKGTQGLRAMRIFKRC